MLLYEFPSLLIGAQLVSRQKRFLAEVLLQDQTRAFAHCPNTGTMKTCSKAGAPVLLSGNSNPHRKTSYTWEMINMDGNWVGVNTALANTLTREALSKNVIDGLPPFQKIRGEVVYGESRLDFLAEYLNEKCFIEVKNVTYCEEEIAFFPDAQTLRGQKHLDTLRTIRKSGTRAAIVFVVQRTDAKSFSAASHIDPIYAIKLNEAMQEGVELYAMQIRPEPEGLYFHKMLPFINRLYPLSSGHYSQFAKP